MKIVDVHAHLNDERYNGRVDEIVSAFRQSGGEKLINSGFDLPSSIKAVEQSEKYDIVYCSVGVHPDEARTFDKNAEKTIIELAKCEKCVAIGEIGFDFHWNKSTEEEQEKAFERQIEIADDLKLPFVVHSRDAFKKTMDFLKDRKSLLKHGFLMHCYAGSAEGVKEIVDLGGYFSFGGVITFKNAKRDDAVRSVPSDKILTETDCPYLTPEPFRGSENTPDKIRYVLEKIASIRGEDMENTAEDIVNNVKRLFGV